MGNRAGRGGWHSLVGISIRLLIKCGSHCGQPTPIHLFSGRRFGSQIIRHMALLGEVLDAEQGLRKGLRDRVVPKGTSLQVAFELAQRIIARSGFATNAAKMMINAADDEDVERTLDSLAGIAVGRSDELKQGLEKFRTKKSPNKSSRH